MNKMAIFLGLAGLVFSLSTSSFAAAGPGYGRSGYGAKFSTPRRLLARAEDSLQMPFAEPAVAAVVGGRPSENMGMDKRQLSIIPNTYFLDADYTSNSGSGSGTGYQYLPFSSIDSAANAFGTNWNNYWNANSVNRNVLPYTYYYYVNPEAAALPAIPPPAPAPVPVQVPAPVAQAQIYPVEAPLPMRYYYSTPYLWGNTNLFPFHGLQFQLQQQQQQQHYSPSSVPSPSASSSYDQPILKF